MSEIEQAATEAAYWHDVATFWMIVAAVSGLAVMALVVFLVRTRRHLRWLEETKAEVIFVGAEPLPITHLDPEAWEKEASWRDGCGVAGGGCGCADCQDDRRWFNTHPRPA